MNKLIATTIVHGADAVETHGSLYLIDLQAQEVHRVFSLESRDIEWFGEEGGRGLRGIALDRDWLYLAAGHRLLALDRRFRQTASWENPYLADCRGICVHDGKLYVVSAGNDCVVRFDLKAKEFDWAMQIQSEYFQFKPAYFDPRSDEGPLFINKLRLRSVHCDEGGMRIAGLSTGGLLHFNGSSIHMSVELPQGAQDARFFRKGIVFNDSRAGVVRYVGQEDESEDRAIRVPFFMPFDHQPHEPDEVRMLKRGYARGLCILSRVAVAGGSTPAGVSIYDLRAGKKRLTVNFTKNVREAVNDIAAWRD
jgi:hypothetical protein